MNFPKFDELGEEILYDGGIFQVIKKTFRDDTERIFDREILRREDSVGILAFFDDSSDAIFVLEWSASINKWVLSIPGGRTKSKSAKSRIDSALMELEEETGYTAGNVTKLLEFESMPSYIERHVTIYIGKISSQKNAKPDPFEYIKFIRLNVEEIIQKAATQQLDYLIDPECLLAIMLWKYGEKKQ